MRTEEQKEKARLATAKWKAANRDKVRASATKWRHENPEKVRAHADKCRRATWDAVKVRIAAWKRANRPRVTAGNRKWDAANPEKRRAYAREWAQEHPEICAANHAKRKARKLQACPWWADKEAVKAVYAEARWLTELTGVEHHVDHEVPLQHPLVSGLHVPANLRAIPAKDNCAKGNRYWLDMP